MTATLNLQPELKWNCSDSSIQYLCVRMVQSKSTTKSSIHSDWDGASFERVMCKAVRETPQNIDAVTVRTLWISGLNTCACHSVQISTYRNSEAYHLLLPLQNDALLSDCLSKRNIFDKVCSCNVKYKTAMWFSYFCKVLKAFFAWIKLFSIF